MSGLPASVLAIVQKTKRDRRQLDRLANRFGYRLWPADMPKPRIRVPCLTRPVPEARAAPWGIINMCELDDIIAGLDDLR